MTDSALPDVVCTLTTKALAERTLEWSDLAPMALSSVALPNGARSIFALADAAAIEDLAAREMTCCGSWMSISTERTDVLALEITTTNPDGLELIRSIARVSA